MPWPPRPSDALTAEDMVTTRVRMERALYDRAEAVAADLGLTYAEYITARLTTVLTIDEAAARTRNAEAQAA